MQLSSEDQDPVHRLPIIIQDGRPRTLVGRRRQTNTPVCSWLELCGHHRIDFPLFSISHFSFLICHRRNSSLLETNDKWWYSSRASFRKRTCPPRAEGGTSALSKRAPGGTSALSKRAPGETLGQMRNGKSSVFARIIVRLRECGQARNACPTTPNSNRPTVARRVLLRRLLGNQ